MINRASLQIRMVFKLLTQVQEKQLRGFAADIRSETIKMISKIGVGHVGGCLSIADVMACLYGGMMKIDPKNPKWEERDRFVLSKGHAGPAEYAALGLKGYFPMEMLDTLNQPPTNLPSHTDMYRTPGVDMTTGSLGQGISSAVGIALGCKLKGLKNYTYVIVGDGESQEGQVWEAAMFAGAKKLSRLIAFVDYNGKQIDGTVEDVGGDPHFEEKFDSCNWNVITVKDGNDVSEIWAAIEKAHEEQEKPTAIILCTVKGKGWKYAEELENNHNFKVNAEMAAEACAEFSAEK